MFVEFLIVSFTLPEIPGLNKFFHLSKNIPKELMWLILHHIHIFLNEYEKLDIFL